MGEPIGPMLNGTTYMVRPRIEPANSRSSVARMAAGSIQLLVGPASACFAEQIKVRSSTRATSAESDRQRYEFGRFFSLSLMKVPFLTISAHRRSYSACEPSHQ